MVVVVVEPSVETASVVETIVSPVATVAVVVESVETATEAAPSSASSAAPASAPEAAAVEITSVFSEISRWLWNSIKIRERLRGAKTVTSGIAKAEWLAFFLFEAHLRRASKAIHILRAEVSVVLGGLGIRSAPESKIVVESSSFTKSTEASIKGRV